jgi:hypothetical protein
MISTTAHSGLEWASRVKPGSVTVSLGGRICIAFAQQGARQSFRPQRPLRKKLADLSGRNCVLKLLVDWPLTGPTPLAQSIAGWLNVAKALLEESAR